jgi:arsenite methyltransferase
MKRAGRSNQINYGIDAPNVVGWFLFFGVAGIISGFIFLFIAKKEIFPWTRSAVSPCFTLGGSALFSGTMMLLGSKIGKPRLRDRIINSISWRGDEMILDVGCGHGLMLIGAAKRLTTGKAIGIDLWQQEDQLDNSREATSQNVRLENVAERVELLDGDARKLPFTENSFDVVLSSWALHNIYDRAGRELAVREIIRVLKPGGRLIVSDIRHTHEYAKILKECQMLNVQRSWPNFLFVTPTFTLTATRPDSSG